MKTVGQKFYRYMSLKEFQKLSIGLKLENKSNHSGSRRTESNGFCFLPEITKFTSNFEDFNEETNEEFSYSVESEFDAVQCYSFLEGIVTNDVLVEFENISEELNESFGIYADPVNMDFYETIAITEYCTETYSIETMRPTRYALVKSCSKADWYIFN